MRVVSEISIKQYKVLQLDEAIPKIKFTTCIIDGISYPIVPMYDIGNIEYYIAVEASNSFIVKTFTFGDV